MNGLEIHGSDEKGNIVAVLETRTTDDLEKLVKQVNAIETVLHVGLTYLNAEDEAELITEGAYTPQVFGRRKGEKLQE
jgi:nitrate reductase NapD